MDRNPPLLRAVDARRNLIVLPTENDAYLYARDLFFDLAQKSIAQKGSFRVALPGGTTPKKLFPLFTEKQNLLDWTRVFVYFGDERLVTLDDPESNAGSAWALFFSSVLPKANFFPMVLSNDPTREAARYDSLLATPLDFILLGMGDDGHIASLFPNTPALAERERCVTANFLPEKQLWRLTLTYKALNEASLTALLVLGSRKAPTVEKVLVEHADLPATHIGTEPRPALWILDQNAAHNLRYT